MKTPPLVFDWPSRHTMQVVMPAMLVLAALFHAGIFFLFSIIYPTPKASSLSPVQVYVPTAGSPEDRQLQAVLRATEPAAFAPGRHPDEPVSALTTQPQLLSTPLALVPAPPREPLAEETPTWFHRPLVVTGASNGEKPQTTGAATKISLSPALAARRGSGDFPFPLETRAGFTPEPAKFLIRVLPGGHVANVFMQSSSGSQVLDNTAIKTLFALPFLPADSETWGVVRFLWGDDLKISAEP